MVFNFEGGAASLKDWGRTGRAFGNQPKYGDNRGITKHEGKHWITSGDREQGTLVSPEFIITGSTLQNFVLFVNITFIVGTTEMAMIFAV